MASNDGRDHQRSGIFLPPAFPGAHPPVRSFLSRPSGGDPAQGELQHRSSSPPVHGARSSHRQLHAETRSARPTARERPHGSLFAEARFDSRAAVRLRARPPRGAGSQRRAHACAGARPARDGRSEQLALSHYPLSPGACRSHARRNSRSRVARPGQRFSVQREPRRREVRGAYS